MAQTRREAVLSAGLNFPGHQVHVVPLVPAEVAGRKRKICHPRRHQSEN